MNTQLVWRRRQSELSDYFPSTDKALLDRWTLGHIGVGAIMRLLGVPRIPAYLIAIVFELSENTLKRNLPMLFSRRTTPDTFPHAFVDMVATISGWEVANFLPPEREGFDPTTGYYRTVGP